jgi:hypothetical protein
MVIDTNVRESNDWTALIKHPFLRSPVTPRTFKLHSGCLNKGAHYEYELLFVKEVQLCAVLQLLIAVLLSQLLPCVRTHLRAAAVVAAAAAVAVETAMRSSSGVPQMQLLISVLFCTPHFPLMPPSCVHACTHHCDNGSVVRCSCCSAAARTAL